MSRDGSDAAGAYAHPFSSYCQKVLTALYENETPFTYRLLPPEDPETLAEWESLWPIKKFLLLVDEARPYRQYFPPGAPDRD